MKLLRRFKEWFNRRTRREKVLLVAVVVLSDVCALSMLPRVVESIPTLRQSAVSAWDRTMSDPTYYSAACRLADHFAAERPPVGVEIEGVAGLTRNGDVSIECQPGQMPIYYRAVTYRWLGECYLHVAVGDAVIGNDKYSIATRFYKE
jgi:hypothetical protein